MKKTALRRFFQVCGFPAIAMMAACGGSGSASSTGPPLFPDFTLAANPTSATVVLGSSYFVSVSDTAAPGFTSDVNVEITGLPAGVTASATSLSLGPSASQVVIFSAAASAAPSSGTVTFTGTSGSTTQTAQLSLSVSADTVSANTPPSRTRYVRTDGVGDYALAAQWSIYNPNTSQFFVSDPGSNHIFVLDAATETEVASLSVPGALGLDDTPDHSTLYVGTEIGDVYVIDTGSLTVTNRYIASQIGPSGFQATSVVVLSNGSLGLLGASAGVAGVDGSPSVGVWDPTTNSLAIYATTYGATELPSSIPYTIICGTKLGNFFGFGRTVDRTEVILGGPSLCELDPSTGQSVYVTPAGASSPIVTSPDGNYIALASSASPTQVALYDPQTLTQVSSIPVSVQTLSTSTLLFSADSTMLFVATDTIVYAYSVSTQQQIGWMPNIWVSDMGLGGPGNSPYLLAADPTGLLVGPMEEGVGFIDSSTMNTGPVGTLFTNAYLSPAGGPLSGGTQAQWGGPTTTLDQNNVYFGSQKAIFDFFTGGLVTMTSPEGAPGPADVYAYTTDGGVQIVPLGFSYGPTILEVTPSASTADGGGTGTIYGFGFGPLTSASIPPDLQITVGGKAAVITSFNPNPYGYESPPYQMESVSYTIPAGAVGSANVTVSNSIGSVTQSGGMTYLPATQQFPLSGAQLAQGIYDPYNEQYYFTDANRIQIFSLSQGSWLAPIPIPAPTGATQRLWGIALSPNGSLLAVSDAMAGVIYTLNPSNPSAVSTYSIKSTNPSGIITNPCGVAISDTGMVYFAVFVQGGTGFDGFFKLDTSTGAVTDYGVGGPDNGTTDTNLRTEISSDNSVVYFNSDGYVFSVDTATDKVSSASDDPNCCYGDYDLSLASNQLQLEASSYFYDAELDAESFFALNDREAINISYVYGVKLDPDGSMLFQPTTSGIDVMDGRLGNLLTRIALPLTLSTNYDALVADGKDNTVIAITGATGDGIAVLNLNSISEPAPLPYKKRTSTSGHRHVTVGAWSTSAITVDARHRGTLPHVVKHVIRPNFPRPR